VIPGLALGLFAALSTHAQEPLMLRPPVVAEPLRLALTPIFDGVVMDQEWDGLAETPDGPTLFQWEPGKLYFGAKPKPGFDVILSLDVNGDGWLVGDDNLEIRATMKGEQMEAAIRQLDATDRNGPQWVIPRIAPDSILMTGKPSREYWNLEGAFEPFIFGKNPAEDSRIGVRIDIVPTETTVGEAYMPRSLSLLRLRFDKSRNLFSGLTWRPEILSRSIARVDSMKFRFNFENSLDCPPLQSVDIVGEGYARDAISQITVPFPTWDRKGRALVDFSSDIKPEATPGYRVLRATVLSQDGRLAIIRTSIRIADLLDLDSFIPKSLEYSDEARVVKGHVTLRSQANGRMSGKFSMVLPESWSARKGLDEDFLIYHTRGTARVPVEFIVPAGASGVESILLKAKIGEKEISQRVYLSIQ
jgi:hypothetical protein